jgi:hypothetical protein
LAIDVAQMKKIWPKMGHLDRDDVRLRDLEHGVEEELLEDGAETARPRLLLDGQARDAVQGVHVEGQLDLGPMLRFLKYFRRKFWQNKRRFFTQN